ncbi:MAG: hypothetical protein HQK51_17840 [Oligoflexia bacterium]|nr:hypothetical protein [Oligoflexia bacterium]
MAIETVLMEISAKVNATIEKRTIITKSGVPIIARIAINIYKVMANNFYSVISFKLGFILVLESANALSAGCVGSKKELKNKKKKR